MKLTAENVPQLVLQLHGCIEEHKREMNDRLEKGSLEMRSLRSGQLAMATKLHEYGDVQEMLSISVGAVASKQKDIGIKVDNLTEAFGLKPDEKPKKHKPIAFMSQTEVVVKVGAGAATIVFLIKYLTFATPLLWAFLLANFHWINK